MSATTDVTYKAKGIVFSDLSAQKVREFLDAQAVRLDVRVLGGEKLVDLLGALVGKRDHQQKSPVVGPNASLRIASLATLGSACRRPTS